MRFLGLLPALVASRAIAVAVPEAQKSNQKFTEQDVLLELLQNPQMLLKSSYDMLKARVLQHTSQVMKRDPQGMSMASIVGGLGVAGAAFDSLFPFSIMKAPSSTVKDVADSKSEAYAGASRRKVRYGPYRLPPTSENNLESVMLSTPGMGNSFKYNAKKPCDKDCIVLALDVSLEFADGSPAENANGAWFHHAVLLSAGPSSKVPPCGNIPIEVIAMAGNEKSSVSYAIANTTAVKSGYHITENDVFILNAQLMNMEDKEKFVWLTITYDYLDAHVPEYSRSRILWQFLTTNTAFNCYSRLQNPFGPTNLTDDLQPKAKRFSEHTTPVESSTDGLIMAAAGHMHDGGVDIDILRNDQVICTSRATYTKGSQSMGGHGHKRRQVQGGAVSNTDIEHISGQSMCTWPKGIPLAKTDKLHIRVNYDFELHPGMKNSKGELDEVMGIVGTMVAEQKPS